MRLVDVHDLTVKRDRRVILQAMDFSISAGEIVTIIGPNGAGKSTFLDCLVGAVKPASGRLHLKPNLRIGYVPQTLTLPPSLPLSVARFLSLSAPHNPESTAPESMGPESMGPESMGTATTGITHLLDRQMTQLSGGEFQRVLLASALGRHPELLLLDEPTHGLDHPGSVQFYRHLDHIRQRLGCAIIMVSHDLHIVMASSQRVICLNGHICCQGPPAQVASSSAYKALFGADEPGVMAIYRHAHDHTHDHAHDHNHDHTHPPSASKGDASC